MVTSDSTEATEERVVRSVILKAPMERVWRALTDHREFGSWFGARIEEPFVVGRTQTGSITEPGAEHYHWRSTVVTMDEPRLFAFRWPHPADPRAASYEGEPETLVTFELEPNPEGTKLTITESGFEAVDAALRAASMRENAHGWEIQSQRIAAYVKE